MARLSRRHSRGFTLVELLIVVAIIGVLSTIGVPTFRKMVTKAKKSEAKVGLGGLFTVESAFFTEYNTYGNNLDKVGFDVEGKQRLYDMGFSTATCGDSTLAPTEANSVGATLKTQITDYYTGSPKTRRTRSTAGSQTGSGTAATNTVFACYTTAVTGFTNAPGIVSALGDGYTASATGNIAPGVAPDAVMTGCSSTVKCQDVWVIDHQRNLINAVDGAN